MNPPRELRSHYAWGFLEIRAVTDNYFYFVDSHFGEQHNQQTGGQKCIELMLGENDIVVTNNYLFLGASTTVIYTVIGCEICGGLVQTNVINISGQYKSPLCRMHPPV